MNFKGHPLHLIVVHFPVALYPMDFVCQLMHTWLDDNSFAMAGFYALLGATVMAWAAVFLGSMDLINWKTSNDQEQDLVVKKGLIHGGIQLAVVMVYSLITLNNFDQFPQIYGDGTLIIILKGILITVMAFGNFIGGELAIKFLHKNENLNG